MNGPTSQRESRSTGKLLISRTHTEIRKRLMWALYCQNVQASSTYGRPSLLRLEDMGKRVSEILAHHRYRGTHGDG